MADAETTYMQSPLVHWVETFKANDGHPLEYRDLYDGVFLNDVMQQIDPRLTFDTINRFVEDASARLHNWEILVKNVQAYYRDVLQHLVVMRLPNVHAICRDPHRDSSFGEIKKALLLILGCAVQCEQKEEFIARIMSLDILVQTEIVENIKEVTDDTKTILPVQRPQSPEGCQSYLDKIFQHLHRLMQERDECSEIATDLGQERDFYQLQAEGKHLVPSPLASPEKHHQALELAEAKAKIRHLRQELEDKQEQLSDLKEELQATVTINSDLKNKNTSLMQEARLIRSLRDELDILKEKAARVDVFEKEILKYKEKLNELEFYKARNEELKEDNSILEETKTMLEDQLANSRRRIEAIVELESKNEKYRQELEEMTKNRESDKARIEVLLEENARLEFERKSSINESASLESELSAAVVKVGNVGSSLSDQITETSHTRILRLELENQRLQAKLADMKEAALINSAEASLELEKENQRLVNKVEKLQISINESSEQTVRLENELVVVRDEKEKLLKSMDTLIDRSDQQTRELEKENQQLSLALQQIRERVEKTSDVKVKDLERENKRLHETVTTKNSQLSKLEFDNRQLQRSCHQLQENSSKVQELEQENQALERHNSELHHKVGALQEAAEKLEAAELENSNLMVENRKLQKTVESLQKLAHRNEQDEQKYISVSLENQRLQKVLESLKSETDRAVELESENDALNKELQQTRKLLDVQKGEKQKQDQLEMKLSHLERENQRLQKSLESTSRQVQQLEADLVELEANNERLLQELEATRSQLKQLEEKELETTKVEAEVQRLQRDKASLERENKKLKQNLDLKDSSLEEVKARQMNLNQELKSQRQLMEKMKETCDKVKDMEQESKDLVQELNTDRRTLATLREELVGEKIRSQELSNELEQLTAELERIGIDKEKLIMAEQTSDANRYQALEMMIDETLKKSGELKDKKILALESRLEESKSRNMKLQEELRAARRESEVMKQRLEEEQAEKMVVDNEKEDQHRQVRSASSATMEILQLKDYLVEVERKNATLLAETDNLRQNNKTLAEQNQKLENQLANLHLQHATVQNHCSSLLEQNAKLQVEYTTQQSQTSSAQSQQALLKNQLAHLESQHDSLVHRYEGLQGSHQSLVRDHESLAHLHQQLTSEYESLVAEHSSLKTLHKALKQELKDRQDQLKLLLEGKDDVNKLRDNLEREQQQLMKELMSLGNLQSDHQHLQDGHQQLRSAYDKLSKEYSNTLASHKQIKTDYNNLQLKHTELQGELSEAKEGLTLVDRECEKLESKLETLYKINERIDNENQALLMQIKQLLNQNHELLMQALNSKDHFAEEEKAYMEKLSDLKRQKERLEEKIMEHYKNRMIPKKKGLGALIARTAKGLMSKGPRRSKSRNNLSDAADGEHSTDQPHSQGARSSEDIHKSSFDSGLLPGLGRPYTFEDEQRSGDHTTTTSVGRKLLERSSQESEMLTLAQFLLEANSAADNNQSDDSVAEEMRIHGLSHLQLSSDSESKKSDHSTTSSGPLNTNWRQQVRNGGAKQPETSLLSPSIRSQELSTGSGSEGSCFSSEGVLPNGTFTSTPKAESKTPHSDRNIPNAENRGSPASNNGFNPSSNTTTRGWQQSAAQSVSGHNRTEGFMSGSLPRNGFSTNSSPITSRFTEGSQQQLSARGLGLQSSAPIGQSVSSQHGSFSHQPSPHLLAAKNSREPPRDPPPAVPTQERPDLVASSIHYAQPYAHVSTKIKSRSPEHNWPSEGSGSTSNRSKELRDGVGQGLVRRKSYGAADNRWQISPDHRQFSPLRSQQTAASISHSQSIDSSVMMREQRPVSHTLPAQAARQRPRPVSVMAQNPHVRGVYSRPPEQRHAQQVTEAGPSSRQNPATNADLHRQSHTQAPVIERSKSVPPHLFSKADDSGEELEEARRDMSPYPSSKVKPAVRVDTNYRTKNQALGGPENRATQSFSSISLIREPSRSQSNPRPTVASRDPGLRPIQPHPQRHSDMSGWSTTLPADSNSSLHNRQSQLVQPAFIQPETFSSHNQPLTRTQPQSNPMTQISPSRPDSLTLTGDSRSNNLGSQHSPGSLQQTQSPPGDRPQYSSQNPLHSSHATLNASSSSYRARSMASSILSPSADPTRIRVSDNQAGRPDISPTQSSRNCQIGSTQVHSNSQNSRQYPGGPGFSPSINVGLRSHSGGIDPKDNIQSPENAYLPSRCQISPSAATGHSSSSLVSPPAPPPRTSSRVVSSQHGRASSPHLLDGEYHNLAMHRHQPSQSQPPPPGSQTRQSIQQSHPLPAGSQPRPSNQPPQSQPPPSGQQTRTSTSMYHTSQQLQQSAPGQQSSLEQTTNQRQPSCNQQISAEQRMNHPPTQDGVSPAVTPAPEAEVDKDTGEPKTTNSVWYEYGCV